jgi:probable phosphoglycerate mutase
VRIQGQLDPPLNETGRAQARELADQVAGEGLAALYTSDMLRARQTAEIIAERLGAPVTVLQDLDEVRVGDLDARDDDASWDVHAQVLARWYAGELDAAFPAGETFRQALARFEAALREIARHHPVEAVAAVTHGAIQLTVLPRLCPTIDASARTLPNVALTTLELSPDGLACSLWGSTAHLAG